MNAPAKIDIGKGYDRLGEAMKEEGIYQIRLYCGARFSVQLDDGRMGVGGTIREAIDNAVPGVIT